VNHSLKTCHDVKLENVTIAKVLQLEDVRRHVSPFPL